MGETITRQTGIAVFAVLFMMIAAFVPALMEASDADPATDLSIYRYTPKLTVTSEDFSAVKYIVWDFGDGTVLDGRWEYYVALQDDGEELSSEIVAGINAYKALLAENGNSLYVTTHTYATTGTFTATVVAMNPLGYVPEGGSAYDGVFNQDDTGYNGGMDTAVAGDIRSPSDADLDSAAFKAVAGSWDRVEYVVEIKGYPTITFDTKGGSVIAPMLVENTSEYTAAAQPADPTREGFLFNGWFTDSDCTILYDWTQKVTAPITLYAGWAASTATEYDHIITYKDGTETIGTQNARNTVNGNVSVTITQDNPMKEGSSFRGWVANEGDSPVYKGATVSVPVAGLVLQATWGAPTTQYTHTIHYTANGGTGAMNDTIVTDNVSGATPMVLANNGFAYENHTFKGWKVGEQILQPGAQVQVEGNATMTAIAQWQETTAPVTIKVTVYVDGTATQFDQGTTIADIPVPTRTGYTFDGWYNSSDFQTEFAGTTVLTNNLYVFAKFVQGGQPEPQVTKITVKVDGRNVQFDQGKKVSDIEKPTKKNHIFEGWYSDEELTNEVADTTVLTDGMVLYSKLTKDPNAPADDNMLIYIIIVIGAIIALAGVFIHPVMLIIGIAVAAFGGLELFGIIDLL